MPIIDIKVESNVAKANEFIEAFGKGTEIAVRRALRRTLIGIRADAYKEARKQYNIKVADVRKGFTSRTWGSPPVGQATFSGGKIPLMRFSPRPAGVTLRKPPVGVSIMVKAQRKIITGSFVARMKKGFKGVATNHLGVFQRSGDDRLPIKEKFGPSLAEMLDNPAVREGIIQLAADRFQKNLDHEIDFFTKQGGR